MKVLYIPNEPKDKRKDAEAMLELPGRMQTYLTSLGRNHSPYDVVVMEEEDGPVLSSGYCQ